MENFQAHARSTVAKYKEVFVELKRATQFTEERDFDARDRIVGRIESLLSGLEDTTIGRGLVKQIYGDYVFPFKRVYSILEKIRKNDINFVQTYIEIRDLSKSTPDLSRESLV